MMRLDLAAWGLAAAAMLAWLSAQVNRPAATGPEALTSSGLLGAEPADFARVTGPVPFLFPADHGAHPEFRNEWWYLNGNLETPGGRPLGFQFTLFRFALDPAPGPDSAWAADQMWMAHLALSDMDNQRFYWRERLARGALDLAGATPEIWWLRDWKVESTEAGWRLIAGTAHFGIELELEPAKPVVLQGRAGYSRKGPEPGNASRYYSITRLDARGHVRVGEEEHAVSGWSWLDREWGTSQLGKMHVGWDWFALQLDDGRDLMYYRLRRPDNSASPYSGGVLVGDGGQTRILAPDEVATTALRWWIDEDGNRWPVSWRLRVAGTDLDLEIEPLIDEQLWRGTVRYWEGAVRIADTAGGHVTGRGYLELSGYAD